QYENSLTQIGTQKKTLQSEIDRLDTSRKKISADISVTQAKITSTNLQLTQLSGSISNKTKQIESNEQTIAHSLWSEYKAEDLTLVEHLLSADGLAGAWEEVGSLTQLDSALKNAIAVLETTKQSLTNDYNATNVKKAQLVSLKKDLAGQKAVLDQNR